MMRKRIIQVVAVLLILAVVLAVLYFWGREDGGRWEPVPLPDVVMKTGKKQGTGQNRLDRILYLNEIYRNYDSFSPLEEKGTGTGVEPSMTKLSLDLSSLAIETVKGEFIQKKVSVLVGGEGAVITLQDVARQVNRNNLDFLEIELLPLKRTRIETFLITNDSTEKPLAEAIELKPDTGKEFQTVSIPLTRPLEAKQIIVKLLPGKNRKKMRVKCRGIYLTGKGFKVIEGMPKLDDFAYGRSHLRHMQALHLRSGSRITYIIHTDTGQSKKKNKNQRIYIDGYLGSVGHKPLTFSLKANDEKPLELQVTKKVPYFRLKTVPQHNQIRLTITLSGDADGLGVLANLSIYRPFEEAQHKNVVYYLIDSLRADKGGLNEPILAKHFKRGAVFPSAYANATRTADSLPTIFTGKYKFMLVSKDKEVPEVPESEFLLAEYFKSKGYVTAAFINNPWLDKSNCIQGFDFLDVCYGRGIEDSPYLSEEDYIQLKYGNMESHIKQFVHRQKDKPVFIYIHTMEPHIPYEPPNNKRRYSANADKKTLQLMFDSFTKSPVEPTLTDPTSHQLAVLKSLYKDQVVQAEVFFAKIKEHLESQGVLNDSAMTILTADHGERFYEHRSWIHGPPDVYDEVLRIPIMIKAPGIAPGVYLWNVQLIDMFPTIMQWLGDPVPKAMVGQPVQRYFEAKQDTQPDDAPVIYSDGTCDGVSPHYAYIKYPLKVIVKGSETEIYDLIQDPEEKVNLSANPQYTELLRQARNYRRQFKRLKQSLPKKRKVMTDRDRQQLKTLGYIR